MNLINMNDGAHAVAFGYYVSYAKIVFKVD